MRQSFAGTYVPPAAQIKNADASIKLEGKVFCFCYLLSLFFFFEGIIWIIIKVVFFC